MPEIEMRLADGRKLNFDKSFPQFNVKKKIYAKGSLKEHSRFEWKCWILDTASLSSYFIATITPTFIFTIAFLRED